MDGSNTDDYMSWILSFSGLSYIGDERTPTHPCLQAIIPIGENVRTVKIFKLDTFERDDRVLGKKLGNWYLDLDLFTYPFFADNHEEAIRQACGIVRKILSEFLSKFSNAESFPLHWEYARIPVNMKTLDKDTNGALRN